jgi:hypothetical protein
MFVLKIYIFLWLALDNRILTWDNFRKEICKALEDVLCEKIIRNLWTICLSIVLLQEKSGKRCCRLPVGKTNGSKGL